MITGCVCNNTYDHLLKPQFFAATCIFAIYIKYLTRIPGIIVKQEKSATIKHNTECFKQSFTMIFQMLLCAEGYENVCISLSVNVFLTLATREHLEHHCKARFETYCITSGSHIEL
jgi:hypothetical protein